MKGNILCKSDGLHVVNSQLPTAVFSSGFVQVQVRLDRLPQPEAGMVAFWHVCWVGQFSLLS